MTLPMILALRWFHTLKFKIVAIAVVTGMVSAIGTTQLVLSTTQAGLEHMLLRHDAEDSERTASLLASKARMLQLALGALVPQVTPQMWHDAGQMTRFLVDKPATNALFDSIFAARADGAMLARLEKGSPRAELPHIADREYFQRALATDQPVVSRPVLGRVTGLPLLLIVIPVRSPDGEMLGIVGGSLALQSTHLFSDLDGARRSDGSRSVVMDRAGQLLAHPDPARVMGQAADEPGLAEVFGRWHDSGSPIDTQGTATLSNGYMVSMAGIPFSDWVLVRLVPQAVALGPLAAARRTAWRAAAGVGLLAGLLAGVLAWAMTRPISQLRARAEQLLTDDGPATEGWPRHRGEVGDLACAFQQVVEQRQRRQGESQAVLRQLQAVFDHAGVGIALTRNGRFELVSQEFCRIFQCEEEHAIGAPTRTIYPSDAGYQALSDRAMPAFMEHGAFDGELELMRRPGTMFWAHMRGRAVVAGDRAQGTIWIIEDVTAQREQRERLAWNASHDSLTGLANRAAFEALLEQATARAAQEPFCVLFIDLDRFKQVNDTAGHAAGDALLRDVATQLALQVRHSDTVARLGGDEFAVVLQRCPTPQAHVIAEELRRAVVEYELVWQGRRLRVGASIGLVAVDASYASAADVLQAADAACYAAKRQGRDRVASHVARTRPRADAGAVGAVRSGLRAV